MLPRTGYHRHVSVCVSHQKADEVTRDGQRTRFCRHCHDLHLLLEFDFGKRRAAALPLLAHQGRCFSLLRVGRAADARTRCTTARCQAGHANCNNAWHLGSIADANMWVGGGMSPTHRPITQSTVPSILAQAQNSHTASPDTVESNRYHTSIVLRLCRNCRAGLQRLRDARGGRGQVQDDADCRVARPGPLNRCQVTGTGSRSPHLRRCGNGSTHWEREHESHADSLCFALL